MRGGGGVKGGDEGQTSCSVSDPVTFDGVEELTVKGVE